MQYISNRRLGLLLGLVVFVFYLLTLSNDPSADSILFALGHQAVRGMATPIVSARILQYTYADKRATVLSISSMASRLFFAASGPIVGWVTEHGSLQASLFFQSAVLALLSAMLFVAYVRIPPKYFRVKDQVAANQ